MSSMIRMVLYAAYQTVQPPSLVAIANFRKGKMRGSTEDRVAFLETKPRKRRDVRRLLY